jgi:hypothetical protein
MFRAVVTKVADRSTFVAPSAHVNAIVIKEACGFDIAFVGPACGTVQERVDAERAGKAEDEKYEGPDCYH